MAGSGTDTYSYVGTSQSVDRINNSVSGITDSILDATGARLGTKVSSTIGWFLDDLLGNVVGAESGSSTTITDAIRYDGFGQTLATYPAGGSSVSKNWKFQDRLDISANATPLYEAGARLYSPGIGTFTSSDSVIGKAQNPITMNRYIYAGANATTNVDPSGRNYYDPGCDCVRTSPISPDRTSVATASTSTSDTGGGSPAASETATSPSSGAAGQQNQTVGPAVRMGCSAACQEAAIERADGTNLAGVARTLGAGIVVLSPRLAQKVANAAGYEGADPVHDLKRDGGYDSAWDLARDENGVVKFIPHQGSVTAEQWDQIDPIGVRVDGDAAFWDPTVFEQAPTGVAPEDDGGESGGGGIGFDEGGVIKDR